VTDPEHAGKRCESWEASIMGPLFGKGCSAASDEALQREDAMLADIPCERSSLGRLFGARRALRVRPGRPILDIDGQDLTLVFELPCDAYVQVVLDELIKPEMSS
jgi:tRNA(Glu) U13 pseudouridine synthase TruD